MKGKNLLKKVLTLIVCVATLTCNALPAMAAETAGTASPELIDTTQTGTLNIVKYDMTKAAADGMSETENVTGLQDTTVESNFAQYAIKDVEFTYIKVADINQVTTAGTAGDETNMATDASVAVTYTISPELEIALGMTGAQMKSDHTYTSNKLIAALANEGNKNDLEDYVMDHGTPMTKTDNSGQTSAGNLPLGLYLVAETSVPAGIYSTSNPFFVSLPMTNSEGTAWQYNVWVYPKNQTSKPTLDKQVKLVGTDDSAYADTTSASIGDKIQYRVISRLPEITSSVTYLSKYDFVDTLTAGLAFDQTSDVTIKFYDDAGLTTTNAVTFAKDTDYTVDTKNSTMTIEMTEAGLEKINPGLSAKYMVVSYQAIVGETAVLGDQGNSNAVQLTYGRSNAANSAGDNDEGYITDESKVFTYGINLQKYFSEGSPDATAVKFTLKDAAGNSIKATLENGVYIVCADDTDDAVTKFSPVADGTLTIRGLKEGTYALTEIETPSGYMLLKESIAIAITTKTETSTPTEGKGAVVTFTEGTEASAKVNDENATLENDGESQNAFVKLAVTNNKGFELPKTGGMGTLLFTLVGALGLGLCLILLFRKRRDSKED